MELVTFGKSQRFPNKPCQTLPQGVVPVFNMGCLSGFLTDRLLVVPKHTWVGLPKIAVGVGGPVGFWDARPELTATVRASVACEPGHDLPGAPAERNPHPAGTGLALDERAQLVQLQNVFCLGWHQSGFKGRQMVGFFLTRPPRSDGQPRRCALNRAG